MDSARRNVSHRCCVCGRRRKGQIEEEFNNIGVTQAPATNKSLKAVLLHIVNFMSDPYVSISSDDVVCPQCHNDIARYDKFVLKALVAQRRVIRSIEKGLALASSSDSNISDTELEALCEVLIEPADISDSELATPKLAEVSEENINLLLKTGLCPVDIEKDLLLQDEATIADNTSIDFEVKPLLHAVAAKPRARKHKYTAICTICGASVKDEEYLELHMNIHEGKTEHECRYCAKQYKRKFSVIRHMQKHWNEQKYQCEQCGLRFVEATVLYNHKLQHEAEAEPLICPECNQTFKTKRTLKGHMRVHQEDRPQFRCPFCSKHFVKRHSLKNHSLDCGGKRKRRQRNERREKDIFECHDILLKNC